MSTEDRIAISSEFSLEVTHFTLLIERLSREYPEHRSFISEISNQHAEDICGIVARFTRSISQDQSYIDPSSILNEATSTPAPISTFLRDAEHPPNWPIISPLTFPDNLFNPDLLQDDLRMVHGIDSNLAHDTASLELSHGLLNSSQYCQAEQVGYQFGMIGHANEAEGSTTVTHSDSTINPAALILEPEAGIGKSGSQITAQVELAEGEKTPKITKKRNKSRAYSLIEPGRSQNSKRRRITLPSSTHVEQMVINQLKGKYLHLRKELTDMYLATASTDSLCQFKDIINTIRQRNGPTLAQKPSTIVETIRMLDGLEGLQQVASFFRRIYLLRLWKLREEIEALLEDGYRTRSENGQPPMLGTGSVASNVFDHVVAEAYPNIDCRPQVDKEIRAWRQKYDGERKAMRNRFQAAKKWKLLSDTFSCGILALIPFGGDFHITNNRLETLPDEVFEVWIGLLEGKEGNCVHLAAQRLKPFVESILDGKSYPRALRLESVGNDILEKSDLSDLIDLCGEVS